MSRKTSSDRRSPISTSFSSLLNYELAYEYSPEKPHQAARIGERYYDCDTNGNLIEESSAPIGQSEAGEAPREQRIGDVRRVDQGWGYEFDTKEKENVYRRFFKWDSENRLTSVSEGADVTSFLYDADGERTSKLGERGERLYFNAWWTANSDVPQAQPRNVANTTEEGSRYRYSKHIFVGSERIVTRLRASTSNWAAEDATTYWYHPDHLGSTSVVTDPDGEAYERIEYTPFGEMWLEHQHDANTRGEGYIPFRFTSKEWDEETGLYYYGARYLEPKLSRWMSADPAGWELVNPMDGEGKPREGYSVVEALNWYSYVSNNPVRYIDPTGMIGQKEQTGTPYFKNGMRYNVIDGLNLLDKAVYGPDMIGTPTLKPGYDSPYALLFGGKARYEQKVNLSDKIRRSLPTGMGNSHADATSQFLTNVTNPDTSIEAKVTAKYKGSGKNRRITEWTLILPMFGIPGENFDNGSNSYTIKIRPVEDKGDAMDFMARNPELIEGILRDAGMLEYKDE